MYPKYIKRILDFFFSFLGLVILGPIIILLTLLLIVANRGKPFFTQIRVGRNEKLFRIIKFRTMNEKRDRHGNLLADKDRLTGVGKLIRKTSLDEIPQLINVLIGDMSLIGPRPLIVEYLTLYDETQKKRHCVRPGISGWAQINGRNAIAWSKKFSLDVWYVKNQSFNLDMKIILITLINVIMGKGVNKENEATTVAFNGKN